MKRLVLASLIICSGSYSLVAPGFALAESCEAVCEVAKEPGPVQTEQGGSTVTCCCLGASEPYSSQAPEECVDL